MALATLSPNDVSRIRSLIDQANESYKGGNYDRAYDLASQAINQLRSQAKATETSAIRGTITPQIYQQSPQITAQQDYTILIAAFIIIAIVVGAAIYLIMRRRK